jgi:glycosyltransferase involved in cell wall biosynthesis
MNRPSRRSRQNDGATKEPIRKLLALETHFTLEAIRQRQLEYSITCKDLSGFFAHVWTVHPFATLLTTEEWAPRYGRPASYDLAEGHTFIEGKVGRFSWLRWLFPLNFLFGQIDLFLRLSQLIRRERIAVIRAASPLYVGLFGLLLARTTGVPLLVRIGANHDQHFQTTGRPVEPRLMRSRRIEKAVERFVLKRADLIAGANQDNLNFALANGARPDRATLFRYGNLIDKRHFVPPEGRPKDEGYLNSLGVEPGKFLLYVGRLEPIKQVEHVVEVLAEIRIRGFAVKAVLAGEGTMRNALENRAAELGVADALMLPGNLSQEQLAQTLPAAAVVVSPHTGRALTEAALGEAPVVAYDVDWQSELIETGTTGILVPHGNVQLLTEAVAALLAEPEKAAQMGKTLRLRTLQMLDPVVLDEHERQEYRKLLTRAKPA